MGVRRRASVKFIFALLFCVGYLGAQTATLQGIVTDQSGAVIPKAQVSVKGSSGLARTVAAGEDGSYGFANLPPGDYSVDAIAPELKLPQPRRISLRPGIQALNLQLQVASKSEQVTVQANGGPTVSTDPANNAGALVNVADGSFEVVWILECAEHLEDRERLIQNCSRVLKPDGTFVLGGWASPDRDLTPPQKALVDQLCSEMFCHLPARVREYRA
jgi:SAM-dependent methyltransferase